MKKKYLFIGVPILIVIVLTIVLFFLFRTNLSKNDALNKAYKYLGKKEVDFSYMKIERDLSDNSYEIKLNDSEYNYEIEIDAKTGDIIDFDKTPIVNVNNPSTNNNYISVEEAKEKVLEHAKLKENEVIFSKVELEMDNNIMVYEIEFLYNYKEYEYEIDATTGNVIKFKVDR